MKIGDIWVKLGLKKDDFSRGLKEAGNEVSGSGGLLGKIKGLKAGAVAAYAAIAAAAVAMADKFVHTSQRLGDQWDQVTAGLKASWRSFISAVNSTDFSGLGKRMATAFKNAREIAASTDQEFEVMNAIEVEKSNMDKELQHLRVQMQNQKLTQKERVKAAEEYLAKVKGVYDKEETYRKNHAEIVKKAYLEESKLANNATNQAFLNTFLTRVADNSALTNALDKYSRKGMGGVDENERRLLAGIAQQHGGAGLEALSKIAQHYQETSDEQAKQVVDAIVKANYAAGAFDQETRRIQSIANQSTSGSGGGKSSDPNQAKAESVLKRAEDSAKTELQILSEKYDAEKALLQQYGLDTNALWDEYTRNLKKTIDTNLSDLSVDIDLGMEDIDMSEEDAEIQKFISNLESEMERAQEFVEDLRDSVIGGFSSAVQELANQFMGLEDINPGRVVQALLTPLADMAVKEGEILIAQGVGVEACKKALESLNGYAAIAAGVALVGIGAAAKAGLSALASTGGRSTSATTYGAGTGSTGTQDLKTEMTVYVKGTIRGSDIVLSGQKTVNNWNR